MKLARTNVTWIDVVIALLVGTTVELVLYCGALNAARTSSGQMEIHSWIYLTQQVGATIATEIWRHSTASNAVGLAIATAFSIQSAIFALILLPLAFAARVFLSMKAGKNR